MSLYIVNKKVRYVICITEACKGTALRFPGGFVTSAWRYKSD